MDAPDSPGFLPPHSNYRGLLAFQKANYLIDRLLPRLQRDFLQEGGLRERMMRARLEYYARQQAKAHKAHRTYKPHKPSPKPPPHP